MPTVAVTRVIPEAGLRLLREAAEVRLWPEELPPNPAELADLLQGCDGALTLLTDAITGDVLDREPGLKVVSNFAVGYDNVDVPAATSRGVAVCNTPGVLTETTADFTWALLMAAARRIPEGRDYVREGRWLTWGPTLLLGRDLTGATLGIVGFGRIGREMARRARGFQMTVLYHDTQRANPDDEDALAARFVDLDELLASSDFVSLHTNLTDETRHLLNAEAFRKMKRSAIVVNTSRGPVIDQRALYEALRDGVIGGAALDVTDPEPMPTDDPLLTLPNCLVVPHIASASHATRAKMAEICAQNLLAGLRGQRLPACVNDEVYQQR